MLHVKKLTTKGLIECVGEEVPEAIRKHFKGVQIPVIIEGKIYVAIYERTVDSLVIHREISKKEIYEKTASDCQHIYQAKAMEATQLVAQELQAVVDALDEITPPWN
jgi:hypothetical protein